jgi:hypothetical protein
MSAIASNLATPLGAPIAVLAPATEFITLTGGMPTAHKARMGTLWLGLQGTFGTLSSATLTYNGDIGEQAGNSPGSVRAVHAIKLGYEVDLEMHWDRGQPDLKKLDRFSVWLDAGDGVELVFMHITEISGDYGDEDTVTRKVKAVHTPGLDDQTSLIRAEVDGLGRVIDYDTQFKFDGANDAPEDGLPTGPVGSVVGTWTRSGTTVTVTRTSHGLTTSDTITIYQSSDETATPIGNETVTVIDPNTFTFVGANAGATSGSLTFKEV